MSEYFLCIFIKGTRGNSRELDDTRGNSRELKGTWVSSREALVEVIKGNKQKTQEKGHKSQERGQKNSGKGAKKRKHRSTLRALKNYSNYLSCGDFHF